MKIYSKDDIKENLKLHDIVVFIVNTEVLEYEVREGWLHTHVCSNNKIFKLLNIENHKLFCKNIYGYNPDLGNFPEYHDGDYAAATRIVIALYDEIEKQSKSSKFKVGQTVKIKESIVDKYAVDDILINSSMKELAGKIDTISSIDSNSCIKLKNNPFIWPEACLETVERIDIHPQDLDSKNYYISSLKSKPKEEIDLYKYTSDIKYI